jgi:hypothetical protein
MAWRYSTSLTRHNLALINAFDTAWLLFNTFDSAQLGLALFNTFLGMARLGCTQQLLHNVAWLYSTPLTWHGMALVNDFDSMARTAFDMAWLGLFDAFDAARRGFDRCLTHGAVDPLIFCCQHNNPPAAQLSKQHVTSNFPQRDEAASNL